MQKEMQLRNSNNHDLAIEERTFSNRLEVIDFIKEILSADKEKFHPIKDKPHHIDVTIKSTNETGRIDESTLRLFGYKDVLTIRATDFIVHIHATPKRDSSDEKIRDWEKLYSDDKYDKRYEYERCFTANLAKDICVVGSHISGKTPRSWFDEKLMGEILENTRDLVQLSDNKFETLIIVFSTLNSPVLNGKTIPPAPIEFQSINLRQAGTEDLNLSTRHYYDQLKAIIRLKEKEGEGLSYRDAVKNVLQNISTADFITACRDYGFTVEQGFASSILTNEQYAKTSLIAFINKWEGNSNLSRMAGELRVEVEQIGHIVKFHQKLQVLKTEGEHLQNKLAAELGGDPKTAKKDERVSAVIRFNNRVTNLEKEVKRNGLRKDYDKQLGKLEESAKQMGLTLQPTENPDEVKKKPLEVGAELCELQLLRSMIKCNTGIAEDEARVTSNSATLKTDIVQEDEIKTASLQKDLDADKASLLNNKRRYSNLQETLKIIQKMVADESTKP